MSLEYKESDKKNSSKVRTIKRNNDLIDLDKYISNLEYNFDDWLDHVSIKGKSLSDDQKKSVREAYRDMLNGYNDGTLTASLGNVTNDSTGKRTNNPDKHGFDSYGIAQTFFNTILQRQSVYKEPTKAKFNKNQAWNNYLSNQNIDYNLFGEMSQDEQNQYLSKLIQDYTGSLNGDDYDDYDSNYGQSVLDLFNNSINDPNLTAKERMDLLQYGIDLSKFYPAKESESEKTEEDLINEEIAAIQKEEKLNQQRNQLNALKWRQQLQELDSNAYGIRDFSRVGDMRTDLSGLKLSDELQQQVNLGRHNRATVFAEYAPSDYLYNGQTYNGFNGSDRLRLKTPTKEYGYLNDNYNLLSNSDKILATQKAYALDWIDDLSDEDRLRRTIKNSKSGKFNNWVVVDTQFDNSGYVTVMDQKANRIGRIPVNEILSTGSVDNYLDDYIAYHLGNNNIPINKEGGILKAQFGETLYEKTDLKKSINEYNRQNEERKEKSLKEKAKKAHRTLEQYKKDNTKVKEDLSATDIARLGAIGADIASLGMSVSGVGSVPGALVGAAGTAANMGADIADGMGFWNVAKNAAIGFGLDALGAIPIVGAFAKAPKIVKTFRALVKSSPYILGAINTLGNTEVTDSIGRILTGEDWTHKDLRNLAYVTSFLTGAGKGVSASAKKRLVKNYANQETVNTKALNTDKGVIKVGDGEGEIKLSDWNKIKDAKSLKDAQQLLTDLKIRGFENAFLKGNRKVPFMDQKTSKSNFIDENTTIYDTSNLKGRWWIKNNNDRLTIESQLNNSGTFGSSLEWIFGPKGTRTSNTPISSPIPTPRPTRKSLVFPDLSYRNLPNNTRIIDLRNHIGKGKRSKKVTEFFNKYKDKRISTNGLESYLNSKGLSGPKPRGGFYINNKLYVFNEGGKIVPFFDNGGVLKGENGLTPKWYLDRYKNRVALKNWNRNLNYSRRKGSDIEGYHGNADSLDDVFKAMTNYINSGNVGKDLQNYFTTKNFTSAEAFRDAYNKNAKAIRDFWNQDVDYNTTDATEHNRLFKEMFSSRSLPKGDNQGISLGYDSNMENKAGSTTWHRRMDQYENEFDLNNIDQSRVHTITGSDGKSFKVYKKANGDIEILPETNNNSNETPKSSSKNPVVIDKSKITGDDDVSTDSNDNSEALQDYKNKQLYPKVLGLSRFFGTLAANKDIYNTRRNSISPVLLRYNEHYSKTHGAKDVRNFYENQAANTENQAKLNYTNDAALNFAIRAEAQKMAMGLREKGMLADNQEIRRTADEELKRVERNSDVRTDTSNKNRASLAETRNILGQLKSDYKLKQWNAVANYLTEQQLEQDRYNTSYRNYLQNAMDYNNQMHYESKITPYKEALKRVMEEHSGDPNYDFRDSPEYTNYVNAATKYANELKRSQYLDMNKLYNFKFNPYSGWNYKQQ